MNLKEYLTKKNISQEDFARSIGLSQPYISQLVNSERLPSLKVASKIETLTKGSVLATDWIADSNKTVK
jgi:transcriptional regulator with XRE-family HTH domain